MRSIAEIDDDGQNLAGTRVAQLLGPIEDVRQTTRRRKGRRGSGRIAQGVWGHITPNKRVLGVFSTSRCRAQPVRAVRPSPRERLVAVAGETTPAVNAVDPLLI